MIIGLLDGDICSSRGRTLLYDKEIQHLLREQKIRIRAILATSLLRQQHYPTKNLALKITN